MGIIRGYHQTNNEEGRNVEDKHPDEDVLRGSRNVSTRVLGLCCSDSERFDTAKGIHSVDECEPEAALHCQPLQHEVSSGLQIGQQLCRRSGILVRTLLDLASSGTQSSLDHVSLPSRRPVQK